MNRGNKPSVPLTPRPVNVETLRASTRYERTETFYRLISDFQSQDAAKRQASRNLLLELLNSGFDVRSETNFQDICGMCNTYSTDPGLARAQQELSVLLGTKRCISFSS